MGEAAEVAFEAIREHFDPPQGGEGGSGDGSAGTGKGGSLRTVSFVMFERQTVIAWLDAAERLGWSMVTRSGDASSQTSVVTNGAGPANSGTTPTDNSSAESGNETSGQPSPQPSGDSSSPSTTTAMSTTSAPPAAPSTNSSSTKPTSSSSSSVVGGAKYNWQVVAQRAREAKASTSVAAAAHAAKSARP